MMVETAPDGPIEPFAVDVDQAVLDDLRARITNTRWPDQVPGVGWSRGTELGYLRETARYWADEFDWRAQERELNRVQHYRIKLDGVWIHFVHERAKSGTGLPLILSHGWPSAFTELLPMIPLLTDPAAHGIDGPAFDLVIPSLPGYGFSERPAHTDVGYRTTAGLWHRLMRELGYPRFGAGGGDFGAGISTLMGIVDPQPLIGIHLSTLEPGPYLGPGSPPLTAAERAFQQQNDQWVTAEYGYGVIQSTKPQTLGYALNDSPAGLAAWILEKWRSWSDSGGDLDQRFDRDFLLTLVTLYWVTASMPTSIRDYADNRSWPGGPLGPDDYVSTPTGVAVFEHHFVPEGNVPREWAERTHNVRRWTVMPSGGHFAAAEEPDLLARDIAAFFAELG
jgi:pimeloyl-ACP methyl ester carboxylesterase